MRRIDGFQEIGSVKSTEKETATEPKPEHTENTHCEKAILEPREIR